MKTFVRHFVTIIFVALAGFPSYLNAQTTFFTNGFNGWHGRTGYYKDASGTGKLDSIRFVWQGGEITNPYDIENAKTTPAGSQLYPSLNGTAVESNQNRFYWLVRDSLEKTSRFGGIMDPNAPLLSKLPPGEQYGVRIGNPYNNAECEGLIYEFKVQPKEDMLVLKYAMVLRLPVHDPRQNPVFEVKVLEKLGTTYTPFSCAYLKVNSDTALIGKDTAYHYVNKSILEPIIYRSWTTVGMDLSKIHGQTVRVEVSTGDCAALGHFGYGYFTGKIGSMGINTAGCMKDVESGVITYAEAPEGFTYQWFYQDPAGNPDITQGPLSFERILPVKEEYFTKNATTKQDSLVAKLVCRTISVIAGSGCYSDIKATIVNWKPLVEFIDSTDCSQNTYFIPKITVVSRIDVDGVYYSGDDAQIYEWDFGDGTKKASTGNGPVMHRYARPGNYKVSLVGTGKYKSDPFPLTGDVDSLFCSKTETREIFVPESPKAGVISSEVCKGEESTLNPIPALQEFDYQWYLNNVTTPETGKTFTHVFDSTAVMKMIVTHPISKCADTATQRIVAIEKPIIDIIAGVTDTSICYGNTSHLKATSSNGIIYTWTHGKTTPSIDENPEQSTTYTVEVANRIGCKSSKSIHVSVMKPSVSISSIDTCANDEVILTATNADNFEWIPEPDDPSLPLERRKDPIIVVKPTQTTNYKIIGGSNVSGCKTVPLDNIVKISPYPIPMFEVIPDYVDFSNPSISLKDRSTYGVAREWIFEDGVTKKEQNITHTFREQDLRKDSTLITLKSYNSLGCFSILKRNLPVEVFSIWAPNAFTPGKAPNDLFKIYSKNDFTEFELRIYDRWGQEVFFAKDINTFWDGTKSGKELPVGTYSWILNFKYPQSDRLYQKKGVVNLIR